MFSRVKPKLGLLTHYVAAGGPEIPPASREQIFEQVRSNYDGPLVAGRDLTQIEVGETVKVLPRAE